MPVVKSLGDTANPERPTVKVLGCGGAGCNTLEDIPAIPGLETIGVNDVEHGSVLGMKDVIYLKRESLKGIVLTAQKIPKELLMAEEKEIANRIEGADIVYIVAGLGGEMGTWAPSLIGKVAKKLNILTMAMVTIPFRVESERRREVARQGMAALNKTVDCVVEFSNDKLLKIAPNLPFTRAFYVMGQLMTSPILNFSRVVTKGDDKLLKQAFRDCGVMRFGAGDGRGRERTFVSVDDAFKSPWFEDLAPRDANLAIVLSSSTEGFPEDLEEVVSQTKTWAPDADIYYGGYKEEMRDRMRTVVLLGFEEV
jgi:cell division protein FtsZ